MDKGAPHLDHFRRTFVSLEAFKQRFNGNFCHVGKILTVRGQRNGTSPFQEIIIVSDKAYILRDAQSPLFQFSQDISHINIRGDDRCGCSIRILKNPRDICACGFLVSFGRNGNGLKIASRQRPVAAGVKLLKSHPDAGILPFGVRKLLPQRADNRRYADAPSQPGNEAGRRLPARHPE